MADRAKSRMRERGLEKDQEVCKFVEKGINSDNVPNISNLFSLMGDYCRLTS